MCYGGLCLQTAAICGNAFCAILTTIDVVWSALLSLHVHTADSSAWLWLAAPVLPTKLPCLYAGARPFANANIALPRVQRSSQPRHICEAASMQFIRGVDEPTVPEVSLRRARTGTSGQALFMFDNPSIFQASSELGDITGELAGLALLCVVPVHQCTSKLRTLLTAWQCNKPVVSGSDIYR